MQKIQTTIGKDGKMYYFKNGKRIANPSLKGGKKQKGGSTYADKWTDGKKDKEDNTDIIEVITE